MLSFILLFYYSQPAFVGIIPPSITTENILAKDKNTKHASSKTTVSTAVAAAGEAAGRIKITGNAIQRAAKIAEHLEAGGSLDQIQVDSFTKLPDNITINSDGTVTPAANDHSADPIPPGTEGTFDPLAPEPFVPTEPVTSVSENETIVLNYTPYTNRHWGTAYSPSLVNRSNELANKIWPNDEAYNLANNRGFFGGAPGNFADKVRSAQANELMFNRHGLQAELQRALGFHQTTPTEETSFMFSIRAREVVNKLRRMEKKYGTDELFSDDTRERIIETILMPTSTFGVSDNYHSSTWLDLRNHIQKAVINEIMSKEDMQVIEAILNYLPNIRSLLKDYTPNNSGYSKEDLLIPLAGTTDPLGHKRYVPQSEDRKLLNAVRSVLSFFEQCIPPNIVQDFIPALRYPRKSGDAYLRLQKTSRTLREASMDYVQGTGTLASLLDSIIALSDDMFKYFGQMVEEIQEVYAYLNRIGVEYKQIVEESAERIQQSELPW